MGCQSELDGHHQCRSEPVEPDTFDVMAPEPPPPPPAVGTFSRPFEGEYRTTGVFDHLPSSQSQEGIQLNLNNQPLWGHAGHRAYDWAMPIGTELFAVMDGVVTFAGDQGPVYCNGTLAERAIEVRMEHTLPDQRVLETRFLHLRDWAVNEGDLIRAGTLLGWSGNSGCSTGPHLHLLTLEKVRNEWIAIDPYGWHGPIIDPWQSEGVQSQWLWGPGQAPTLYRSRGPFDVSSSTHAMEVRYIRGWGGLAETEAANELVVFELGGEHDKPEVELGGWHIRNQDGRRFYLPEGLSVSRRERLSIVSGKGFSEAGVHFLQQEHGVWSDSGDCVMLFDDEDVLRAVKGWGPSATIESCESQVVIP